MDIQDKILSTVLDLQSDIVGVKDRLTRVENIAEQVFNKMDGFLVVLNRHEAEIAALRSRYERLNI